MRSEVSRPSNAKPAESEPLSAVDLLQEGLPGLPLGPLWPRALQLGLEPRCLPKVQDLSWVELYSGPPMRSLAKPNRPTPNSEKLQSTQSVEESLELLEAS